MVMNIRPPKRLGNVYVQFNKVKTAKHFLYGF